MTKDMEARLECLKLANLGQLPSETVVRIAQQYYDFLTGNKGKILKLGDCIDGKHNAISCYMPFTKFISSILPT